MRNRLLRFFERYSLALGVIFFLLFITTELQAQKQPKATLQSTISVNMDNNSVVAMLTAIEKRSGIKFIYNPQDLKELPPITHNFDKVTIESILEYCFANSKFKYSMVNNSVVIERRTQVNRVTVFGTVKDINKVPLPGATVFLKGTTVGVSADGMGRYNISFAENPNMTLVFSFIGNETREITINQSTELNIMLKDTPNNIEDIVVNGSYSRDRNTFSGSATSIKGEDLLAISTTNLIQAIATLTPGLAIVENSAQGSNPNAIPEILIRGANSIVTSEQEKAFNAPLIVLDGVEISMERLYDLDMFEIERVDVLKDAEAAIVYGDRAANGVIVVQRYRVADSKVRLNYNFVPSYSIPEISSINVCNAYQKLELERLAGLYSTADGSMDKAYAYKLENIRRGVNTDWLRAPLRVSLGHSHSLNVTGRGQNIEYRAGLNFADSYGVMKGDNRRRYGMNFYIGYQTQYKLNASFTSEYTMTDTKNSPYGDYGQYARMNPYEPIYDEFGDYIKAYYFDPLNPTAPSSNKVDNPLYNATLSSFHKTRSQTLSNTLQAEWYITKLFKIDGRMNLSIDNGQIDSYTSPDDSKYISTVNPNDRGRYTLNASQGLSYSGEIAIKYSKMFGDKGSGFTLRGSSDIYSQNKNSASTIASGFLKDYLSDIKYAMGYEINSSPSGEESISARVGFALTGSYIFRNRYYVNANIRSSGSSQYGASSRFGTTWSIGAGWNVHKEKFMADVKWLNSLRLRWSLGVVGANSFNSTQAMTIYKYTNDLTYYTGIGTNPVRMGNPNLKWQMVNKNNMGVSASLFKERLNVTFDYYTNTTKNAVMSMDMPHSSGVQKVKVNYGRIINSGYDISVAAQVIKTKDFLWTSTVNGAHVMDKITRIDKALLKTEFSSGDDKAKPTMLFTEGGSSNDIFAVRSAGIDPATGQEIYINRRGEYTYDYKSDDRVVVGNSNPTLYGSWVNSFRYKGFSLSFAFTYTFGADFYNSTIKSLVEDIDPKVNVDARAFTDRWKNPGDLSRYLAIGKRSLSEYSERFVERKNEIHIQNITFNYEFATAALKRIGFKRLLVGFGLSDIGYISSVKYERGNSYPYCRSFNLTFRPTF